MFWMYFALVCLLASMVLIYKMRRIHLERQRLERLKERRHLPGEWHSVENWRAESQMSLARSQARRAES